MLSPMLSLMLSSNAKSPYDVPCLVRGLWPIDLACDLALGLLALGLSMGRGVELTWS